MILEKKKSVILFIATELHWENAAKVVEDVRQGTSRRRCDASSFSLWLGCPGGGATVARAPAKPGSSGAPTTGALHATDSVTARTTAEMDPTSSRAAPNIINNTAIKDYKISLKLQFQTISKQNEIEFHEKTKIIKLRLSDAVSQINDLRRINIEEN
ncbi:hypothetical protein CEXT_505291 [Caerostris extrusa]|uniref:Uncharacterized protein n=1 Tax=Caerostris extrusa TaxID=172846 RepID=A0AAV4UCS1_CAEEX|nr:hypothetical protein CEXT_505291 [Caerostris extrusa]